MLASDSWGHPDEPTLTLVPLLATEAFLLGIVIAGIAGLHQARLRPLRVAARGLPPFLLVLHAISLAAFAQGGLFMDWESFRFAVGHVDTLLGFLWARSPTSILAAFAGVTLLASTLRWWPPLVRSLSPALRRRGARLAAGAWIVSGGLALAGDLVCRGSREPVHDAEMGVAVPLSVFYGHRRDTRTGPLLRALSSVAWSRGLATGEDGDEIVVRRTRQSMPEVLAGLDPARLPGRPVILVVVDSLRPDVLVAYGGERPVMPGIDAVARESRVYADAYAQASHTHYSNPAFLSSHYPLKTRGARASQLLTGPPDVLVSAVLKAVGYRTALISSQTEHWGGLADYWTWAGGFDFIRHAASSAATPSDVPGDFTIDDRITVDAAIDWIRSVEGRPFFLFLNLHNAHFPYRVSDGVERLHSPGPLPSTLRFGAIPRELLGHARGAYLDALRSVDLHLGRLIDALKRMELWDRCVFIVTSDHGQAFLEHGMAMHAGPLFDEVLRIPLLIRAPGLPAGRDPRPAQAIDVPPTICALTGLPVHPSFQGEDLTASSFSSDRPRFLVVQTGYGSQTAVVRSGWKLIRDHTRELRLLFHLDRDPGETRNLAERHPEMTDRLERQLEAWHRAQLRYYGTPGRRQLEYPPVLRWRE